MKPASNRCDRSASTLLYGRSISLSDLLISVIATRRCTPRSLGLLRRRREPRRPRPADKRPTDHESLRRSWGEYFLERVHVGGSNGRSVDVGIGIDGHGVPQPPRAGEVIK